MLVLANGSMTVAELSKRFGVSPVTIRSDLEALERQGLIKRNYGGAVAPQVHRFSPSFQEQTSIHRQEKLAIARRAAELVEAGDTVILDAGSTTLFLARELRERELTVVVNSVYALNALVGAPKIELIVVGGSLYEPALCMVGPLAEAFLEQIHVDKAFIGVNGVSEQGISVNNAAEAGVKRRMVRAADQVIVLADHSKLGLDSFVSIAPLGQVDTLITDSKAPEEVLETIKEAGVEVLVA